MFLLQLTHLANDKLKPYHHSLHEKELYREQIERFDVPRELTDVFIGYYKEYIDNNRHACVRSDGLFFSHSDDWCEHDGVYNKLECFLFPLVLAIEEDFPDLLLNWYIEPLLSGSVRYAVIVSRAYGKSLTLPFVILEGRQKAWMSFFSSSEPETVYSELEAMYNSMKEKIGLGLVLGTAANY
ncbi:MAG: hypothetical protein AB1330_01885 [Bacillota bacterium]